MKVNVFLSVAGQEALAKGSQISYYHFDVRQTADSMPEGYEWQINPPAGAALIAGNIELTLPDKETATRAALAKIEVERQELRAELGKALAELATREQSLLALTYSAPLDLPEVL